MMRRSFAVLTLAGAVAVTVLLATRAGQSDQADATGLAATGLSSMLATAPDLASYGITLSAPPGNARPTISASAAAAIASGSHGTGAGRIASVREEALVTVNAVNSSIPQGALVWAVSLMPPGGLATYLAPDYHTPGQPPPVVSYPTGYYVMFIDATTGADLGAVGEGDPAPSTSAPARRAVHP